MSHCKGCRAEIVWVKTEAGKSMPCDAAPIAVFTSSGAHIKGWVPHWTSCPEAKRFKAKPDGLTTTLRRIETRFPELVEE